MHDSYRRTIIGLAWTGPASAVLYAISWVFMAGFLPPTHPTDSAEAVAGFYTGHNLPLIQAGLSLSLVALSLIPIWGVSVTMVTRRMERGLPALSYVQLVTMAIGMTLTILACLTWATAAYRPGEISPEITRSMHDFGWIVYLLSWPPFSVWMVAIGAAIIRDRSERPLLPRWAAYLCFWEALLIAPEAFVGIFKTGPFAYNGVFGLWIPLITFFIWIMVLTVLVLRAAPRLAAMTPAEEATGIESERLQPTA